MKRRHFIRTSALLAASGSLTPGVPATARIKPERLVPGDSVGFLSPGGAIRGPSSLNEVRTVLTNLGLTMKEAPHVYGKYGYFSGTDEERLSDLHDMFADPAVKAIIATRGGSGCNRLLPRLDYDLIRTHPKILMGYSDITALLNAITARSGLITFHGPVGTSTWNDFTLGWFRNILMEGQAAVMENPAQSVDPRTHITLRSGTATGRLFGGNLSVLSTMIGSPYLPDWSDTILFLEDIEEDIYRIDRILMHLKLAGILDSVAGLIFAQCTDCDEDDPGFSLLDVLEHYCSSLNIPVWYGSMIGHIHDKFTLPVGLPVTIDADRGRISLLEPAVTD
ncbi:MAG: LD-carboxypeptidase [Fidelibacterota bacterium]